MGNISRVALFGKLNSLAYKAAEGAAVFTKLRGNSYIEIAHWIHQMLQLQNSDIHCIVKHFQLDAGKLARDLVANLDKLPRGSTAQPDFAGHFEDAIENAWTWASLKYGVGQIRTGHLVVAMLKTRALANILSNISREF